MTTTRVRPMAHRAGPRHRLVRIVRGQPPAIVLGALLLAGAGGLALAGPNSGDRTALAALTAEPGAGLSMPSGGTSLPLAGDATLTAAGSSVDVLTGAVGAASFDPLDLITKGVVVAALLLLTLRVLRRLQAGPAGGSRLLEVIETRPLGPKASLHLVAIGERRLVVGLTSGGMVALADLDGAELAHPATTQEPAGFAPTDGGAASGALVAAGVPGLLADLVRAGRLAARQVVSGGADR